MTSRTRSGALRGVALAWILSCVFALPAWAADGVAADGAAQQEAQSDPVSFAIPIASIAIEATSLESFLRTLERDLASSAAIEEILEELPDADVAVLEFSAQTESRLEAGYDRGELDSLDSRWASLAKDFQVWESTLSRRLATLNEHREDLIHRDEIWEATAAAAHQERVPEELRSQVALARSSLKAVDRRLRETRDRGLGLQKRVVAVQGRIHGALEDLARARTEVLTHVLQRNDRPFWAIERGVEAGEFQLAFVESREGIVDYARRDSRLIWMHVLLIAFVVWASWMSRRWVSGDSPGAASPIPEALTHPVSAGLVLGLSASMWLYTDSPPKLGWLLGLATLPFLFFVLRSLLPPTLGRPVAGLVLLVVLDFARRVLMDLEILSRGLLVLEAVLAMVGLILLRRPERLAQVPRGGSLFWIRILGVWLHLSFFGAMVALLGGLLGWTSLADLLLSALVIGTYLGAILFTASRVVEAIAEASVRSGKLDRIRILRTHRGTFLGVVARTVRTLGFLTWLDLLLRNLAIREAVYEAIAASLAAPIGYGSFRLTLGGIAAFGLTLWISWLLSRFLSALLEYEVFTRVTLPRGVPFALSTMSRYTILVLGFIAAIAVLGFEVGNLALLVSALGVGIGFGMQNMVNNFISGLILLFERPIKVGDLVSLDQLLGNVARIGIRSSTIRTFDGADVIVPNGDLISNQVTNWTLADTRRRVTLPIGVKYGTDAQHVIDLLVGVARAHPAILVDPSPVALFTGFGDSSLDFELRAWTESDDALTIVRSEIAVAVQQALAEASIEVPFPQRDLYLKSTPEPGPR